MAFVYKVLSAQDQANQLAQRIGHWEADHYLRTVELAMANARGDTDAVDALTPIIAQLESDLTTLYGLQVTPDAQAIAAGEEAAATG